MYAVSRRGFTIVELLIVIVVIAILATLIVVAYNGIQDRANDTSIQADLKNMSTAILNTKTLGDDKPPAATVAALSTILKPSKAAYYVRTAASTASFVYCRSDTSFALIAQSKSNNSYVSVNGAIHKTATAFWGGSNVDSACQTNSSLMTSAELTRTGFASDPTYAALALFTDAGWAL